MLREDMMMSDISTLIRLLDQMTRERDDLHEENKRLIVEMMNLRHEILRCAPTLNQHKLKPLSFVTLAELDEMSMRPNKTPQ
jgi:hypothetical protein